MNACTGAGMKLTGHKSEAVYRHHAIVAENDLREAGAKLAAALGAGPATASLSDRSRDHSVTARCRELLDTAPVWSDRRAHRAAPAAPIAKARNGLAGRHVLR